MKKTFQAVLAVLAVSLCVSCNAKSPPLKDGYYTAMSTDFDHYGWKEYVTICTSAGRIILIEFNAFNGSGFLKSWDMNYMRLMNMENGTYPNAYTRYFTKQALKSQGTAEVDGIAGATSSYRSFIKLAGAAIENARLGMTDTRLVQLENIEYGERGADVIK